MEANCYLVFDGNCREAMETYTKYLDAKLESFNFGDMPGGEPMPDHLKKRLMHARISLNDKTILMASDSMPDHPVHPGNNFHVSLQCENEEQIDKLYKLFSDGAKMVYMPLQETFWAKKFAMLQDKFGIQWMLNFYQPKE